MSIVIHLFSKTVLTEHNFDSLVGAPITQPEERLTNDDMRDNEANVAHESQPKRKERLMQAGLKYYPRANLWKASNVMLNPDTLEAYSYDWWRFLEQIGGKLIFNSYRYSNTTSRHQSKVAQWLTEHNYAYETIEAPKGLQNLDSALALYESRIETLEEAIKRPRSKEVKNMQRKIEIQHFQTKIKFVKRLKEAQNRKAV